MKYRIVDHGGDDRRYYIQSWQKGFWPWSGYAWRNVLCRLLFCDAFPERFATLSSAEARVVALISMDENVGGTVVKQMAATEGATK